MALPEGLLDDGGSSGRFAFGDKFQGAAVDAVALVGGGIEAFTGEHVAEVAVADRADHLCADGEQAVVEPGYDVLRLGGVVERGPTAAGVEFLVGGEQERVAGGAVVAARAVFFELIVGFAVGAFGAGLAEDVVLFRGEFLAPFRLGFHDFGGRIGCVGGGRRWIGWHWGLGGGWSFRVAGGGEQGGGECAERPCVWDWGVHRVVGVWVRRPGWR